MANIIYLTLKGKKQGLISAGCGSLNSIGNHYQHGHETVIPHRISDLKIM